MEFLTAGTKGKKVILFFHALGVTGESSLPVARYLENDYYIIMPTGTAFCGGQTYVSRQDEVLQLEDYLAKENICELELVVASSLGADLCTAFLSQTGIKVNHVFIDGGQFAQISLTLRKILTPIMYKLIKGFYKSNGKSVPKTMKYVPEQDWQYFVKAGKNVTYKNFRTLIRNSLEKKPYLPLSEELQKKCVIEFGSIEEHYKYRDNVMKAYPLAKFPVFKGDNHMQMQIEHPEEFAGLLRDVMADNVQ